MVRKTWRFSTVQLISILICAWFVGWAYHYQWTYFIGIADNILSPYYLVFLVMLGGSFVGFLTYETASFLYQKRKWRQEQEEYLRCLTIWLEILRYGNDYY